MFGLLAWLAPGALLVLAGGRGAAIGVWCRIGLWALGARVTVKGAKAPPGALVVANHSSYVDIFALGAAAPGIFVAKSEIAGWPLIGWVCMLAGVIFVERKRAKRAVGALELVRERLDRGERVLLFPEGGIATVQGEVTRFYTMFFDEAAVGNHLIVPAAIRYVHPADPKAWLWLEGETPFSHLLNNLLPADYLTVAVNFGEPLSREGSKDRKAVADAAHAAVEKLWLEAETSS